MVITFKKLVLHNFKSHRDLTVDFGELTKITGDNAKGKSSIPEALCWTLYGTDALGSKMDPTPIGYDFDEVKAELLLIVDDKPLLIGRGVHNGKAQYWVNEVPSKATELDQLVQSLFDKNVFLSLFNPNYFFSLNWTEQRAMILRYSAAPANSEVFKHMSAAQADKLAELVKKHTLNDLEKIHKDNKNKQDKAYIAAQSRSKTLLEQIEQIPQSSTKADDTKARIAELDKQIKEIEVVNDAAGESNHRYNTAKSKIAALQEQISASATKWPALRDEKIADTCRTCKQPLQDDAVEAVALEKEQRVLAYKEQHAALVAKRKEAEAELASLQYVDISEQYEKARQLERDKQPLLELIRNAEQRAHLVQMIDQAKSAEAATLASRNESVFILDAIKALQAKEAELQAAKVQDLFTALSIRLFKQNKGDGEIKPDFEIEMDGKPYRKLSLSESIRAGLELRDVLSQQSGIVAPCFVDNAESITRFTQPNGQLILCRVVAGQDLKVETEASE